MTMGPLPERLNAASVFVDVHVNEGRAAQMAILCGERAITYRELYENVNRFGNLLRGLDVRMEERVAFLLPDTPEWAYVFFGTMKLGAVALPLNTTLKPANYEYFLKDSRTRVLVVHESLVDRITPIRKGLKHLRQVLVVGQAPEGYDSFDAAMERASADLQAADTSKDDMAFWLYSSGTTGLPKAAIHLHHDMIIEADCYARQTLGLQGSDVSFSVAKLFFAYGLGNGLYFPLRLGGTTVLLPDRPTAEAIFQTIDRYQPTVFYGVPTSYAQLLHTAEMTGRTSLGRVRMCVSAGEPLPKNIFESWRKRFGMEILDGIGSTEILHIFISNRPGQAVAGSTGQLVPGYAARILDDEGRELPNGEVGTLWIKGDSIAAGYWNKHEQTKQTFCGEWINTYDKFMIDEDGYFWYMGRANDMFKVSGQAVWPTDVENVLQEHDAVLECGVVGAKDPDGLVKPVAYVVLKQPSTGTAELAHELQQFVKQKTAPYKYPRAIVFVDELPKTATGKIKRYLLRERADDERPLRRKA
jgi:benzoate-CoA ligase